MPLANYWSYALGLLFFIIAFLAKWSQLRTGKLHNMDFWLFVDLLEQASNGGFWLTRFAPQEIGWVQHGAVHTFAVLFTLLPAVKLLGAKWVALAMNPFAISLAGVALASLAKPYWGGRIALLFQFSFYALGANGKTLMYETHPEAFYPLLVFCSALAVRINQTWLIFLAVFLLYSLKMDILGFGAPLAVWLASTGRSKKTIIFAATAGLTLQIVSLRNFSLGSMGPSLWDGATIFLPQTSGGGLSNSLSLDTLRGLYFRMSTALGGSVEILTGFPFLEIIAPVFWLVFSVPALLSFLGLSIIYGMVPGAIPLWNYYSAPWVGVSWAIAIHGLPKKLEPYRRRIVIWTLLVSGLIHSGSPKIYLEGLFESDSKTSRRLALKRAVQCIPSSHKSGMISPGLTEPLWETLKERLITDRWSGTTPLPKGMDFIILEKGVARYAFSKADSLRIEKTMESEAWLQTYPTFRLSLSSTYGISQKTTRDKASNNGA